MEPTLSQRLLLISLTRRVWVCFGLTTTSDTDITFTINQFNLPKSSSKLTMANQINSRSQTVQTSQISLLLVLLSYSYHSASSQNPLAACACRFRVNFFCALIIGCQAGNGGLCKGKGGSWALLRLRCTCMKRVERGASISQDLNFALLQ